MTEDSENVKVTRVQASQATGARRATKDAEASQVTGWMRNDMNVLASPAGTVNNDGWVVSEQVVSREASVLDMLRMDGRGSEGWRDWFEGVESEA
jgi:hypothetical protein